MLVRIKRIDIKFWGIIIEFLLKELKEILLERLEKFEILYGFGWEKIFKWEEMKFVW